VFTIDWKKLCTMVACDLHHQGSRRYEDFFRCDTDSESAFTSGDGCLEGCGSAYSNDNSINKRVYHGINEDTWSIDKYSRGFRLREAPGLLIEKSRASIGNQMHNIDVCITDTVNDIKRLRPNRAG
jgi:hypothetical protein